MLSSDPSIQTPVLVATELQRHPGLITPEAAVR
jgi:hypothetical protein